MTRSAYMLSRAKNSIISSETDLISLLLSYCIATHPVLRLVLVGSPLQKSLMLRRFKSDQDKFCRNVLQINAHRLTETDFRFHVKKFQDDGHDVISCRKVPPPGEWTRSVCRHICSSVLPVPDLYYIRTCYIYILRLTHSGGDVPGFWKCGEVSVGTCSIRNLLVFWHILNERSSVGCSFTVFGVYPTVKL